MGQQRAPSGYGVEQALLDGTELGRGMKSAKGMEHQTWSKVSRSNPLYTLTRFGDLSLGPWLASLALVVLAHACLAEECYLRSQEVMVYFFILACCVPSPTFVAACRYAASCALCAVRASGREACFFQNFPWPHRLKLSGEGLEGWAKVARASPLDSHPAMGLLNRSPAAWGTVLVVYSDWIRLPHDEQLFPPKLLSLLNARWRRPGSCRSTSLSAAHRPQAKPPSSWVGGHLMGAGSRNAEKQWQWHELHPQQLL